MKGNIILETWFETGLGDFYACLISLKEAYDKFISMGYEVDVRVNSKVSRYGNIDIQNKLIEDCFDFNLFNNRITLNNPIDGEYVKISTIAYAYNIYTHNNVKDIDEIKSIDLYGYSVENVAKGGPYPTDINRNKMLFNDKFLNEIERIVKPFDKFIIIHLRYSDDHVATENDINQITQLIIDINNKDSKIKILLSCDVKEINDIRVDGVEMITFNYEVTNQYDRMKRDLLNMCIFAYCEKLYTRTINWSNYQTLGLMHNINGKSYEDYIEKI
jgi:hypothetical protein